MAMRIISGDLTLAKRHFQGRNYATTASLHPLLDARRLRGLVGHPRDSALSRALLDLPARRLMHGDEIAKVFLKARESRLGERDLPFPQ
jgi:hypothetical protein